MNALLLILLALFTCPNALATDATHQVWTLRNDHVHLEIEQQLNGVHWKKYIDRRTGFDLIDGGSMMFRLDYRKPDQSRVMVYNSSGWDNVQVSGSDEQLAIAMRSAAYGTVAVALRLRESDVLWSMDHSRDQTVGALDKIIFPAVELAPLGDDGSDDYSFYPMRFGRVVRGLIEDPSSTDRAFRGEYPGGSANLTLMGVYDGQHGFAMWSETENPGRRRMVLQPNHYPTHSRLYMVYEWPVPSEGTHVTSFFPGDWFDASQRYREAVKRVNPERFVRKQPSAISSAGFWISEAGPPTSTAMMDRIKNFRAALSLPVIFHWYNWHEIKFDDQYPGFLPPRSGFVEAVADLTAHGISVMPYLNANLWDKTRPDFHLEEMLINQSGDTVGFPNSNLVQVCPTSQLFQRTIADISSQLVSDYGASGIYLDQLAAVPPSRCFNPEHQHDDDDFHWWFEKGVWQMAAGVEEAIQTSASPGPFVTSEWANEAFVGKLDAALVNYFVAETPIPLFNAVYHDVMPTFGRFHWRGVDEVSAYRTKLGQSLVFGDHLGWLDSLLLENPEIRQLSIATARLRYRFKDQFDGPMLRPPVLIGDPGSTTTDWNHYWKPTPLTLATIQTGAFASVKGSAISVVVNVGDEARRVICGRDGERLFTTNGVDIITVDQPPEGLELEPGQAMILERHVAQCVLP